MKKRSLFLFSTFLLLAGPTCGVAAVRAAERVGGRFDERAAGVIAVEPFAAEYPAERSVEPFAVARAAEYPVEHLAVARAADFPAGRNTEFLAAERSAEPFVAARAAGPTTDRAAELLAGLSGGFRAMNGYAVAFTVTADELLTRGRYAVEGEGYYLTLGDAEVFSDGALRYEVDNRRREITVDRVDTSSRNILSNPVHAFDFLDSAYGSELLWERDGRAAVALTPVAESGTAVGRITVTVSTASMRPLALTYDYDGERIDVTVERIDPLDGPLRRFDRADYAGYEFIDFR